MLEITIKLTASPELLDAIKLLAGHQPSQPQSLPPAIETTAQPAAEKPKPVKSTKAPVEPAPVEQTAPVEANAAITLEQVRVAIKEKAGAGKREALKQLLDSFNAPRATDLKAADYPAFLEKLNEL